jgi:hypothetical protein
MALLLGSGKFTVATAEAALKRESNVRVVLAGVGVSGRGAADSSAAGAGSTGSAGRATGTGSSARS